MQLVIGQIVIIGYDVVIHNLYTLYGKRAVIDAWQQE